MTPAVSSAPCAESAENTRPWAAYGTDAFLCFAFKQGETGLTNYLQNKGLKNKRQGNEKLFAMS